MTRQPRLRLEQLEDRLTPVTFGFPWPNASHLTVSFVPDRTTVGTLNNNPIPSQLFSLFGAQGISASVWQGEVLRALQTWAAHANISFSVVADDGEPLGTPGALQGDPRFGDIRIAAASLSPGLVTAQSLTTEAVSTSVPFDPTAGTWAGDMLFNANYTFGVGDTSTYDIYSIALHEAGHILGLDGNITDTSSALFEYYNGIRTGLSASDITSEQQLYGVRRRDRGKVGDDSDDDCGKDAEFNKAALNQFQRDLRAAATHLKPTAQSTPGHEDFYAEGSLSGNGDVDFYRLRAPRAGSAESMTVLVWRKDPASVTPAVTVYDAKGDIVAADVVVNADGTEVVRVAAAQPGALYFIAVRPASSASNGRYALGVEFGAPATAATFQFHGSLQGAFGDLANQANFHSIELPQAQVLNLTITAGTSNTTTPTAMEVTLYDNQTGNIVFDQVIPAGQTLQKTVFLPAGTYVLRLVGGTQDMSALLPMEYTATIVALSEPIGPKLINPDAPPPRDTKPTGDQTNFKDLLELFPAYDPFKNQYIIIVA
jgi:hypothetical protein